MAFFWWFGRRGQAKQAAQAWAAAQQAATSQRRYLANAVYPLLRSGCARYDEGAALACLLMNQGWSFIIGC